MNAIDLSLEQQKDTLFHYSHYKAMVNALEQLTSLPKIEKPIDTIDFNGIICFENYFDFLASFPESNPDTVESIQNEYIPRLKTIYGEKFLEIEPVLFHHFLLKLNAEKSQLQSSLESQHQKALPEKHLTNLQSPPPYFHDIDTLQTVDKQVVHIAETIGRRNAQEDQFFATTVRNRDSRDIPILLQQQLHKQAEKNKQQESGSTATLTYLSIDNKLTVGNIGDSRSVLFIRNKQTGEITSKRLTTDHKPNDPLEESMIKRDGGYIWQEEGGLPRLNGTLALARAIGDTKTGAGLSSHADISQYDLNLYDPSIHELYLMVSCDGLYETLREHDYIPLLKQYFSTPNTTYQNPAKAICDFAYSAGSGDNISVLFTKIEPNRNKDIALAIFDGHGGKETAKNLKESLGRTLQHITKLDIAREQEKLKEIFEKQENLSWQQKYMSTNPDPQSFKHR